MIVDLNKHSKLVERPLTRLQRRALETIASGRYRVKDVYIGYQHFQEVMGYNGQLIGGQIASLRRRKFIKGYGTEMNCTVAGAFELYFEPERLID